MAGFCHFMVELRGAKEQLNRYCEVGGPSVANFEFTVRRSRSEVETQSIR